MSPEPTDAALRIAGYQASRDYSIEVLAKALGVEADKVRAVEYYATQAAARIEALSAVNHVMLDLHAALGVPFGGNPYQRIIELQQAEARAAALERDALRYRWLRYRTLSQEMPNASGVALDRAIDAALVLGAAGGER